MEEGRRIEVKLETSVGSFFQLRSFIAKVAYTMENRFVSFSINPFFQAEKKFFSNGSHNEECQELFL